MQAQLAARFNFNKLSGKTSESRKARSDSSKSTARKLSRAQLVPTLVNKDTHTIDATSISL